jgi:hypothetical protein
MPQYSVPPGGKLQIVDQNDSRLVISVPAGGKKARGIGCFAVAWLAITIPISLVFLLIDDADWEGGKAPPLLAMVAFFSLFYAVGFGMLYAWIRMRFMQVLVAVEPGRLTIQRSLFGRKKLKRCELPDDAHAELVESYRSNEVPVYTVKINTLEGDETFATALSRDEKQWIADTINRFLGYEVSAGIGRSDNALPAICDECGCALLSGENKRVCPDCGKVFTRDELEQSTPRRQMLDFNNEWANERTGGITAEPPAIAPFELSADSQIRIEREEPECLQFSYRVKAPLILRVFMGGFLLIFSSIWYGFVLWFLFEIVADPKMGGEKWFVVAFLSLFLLAGLGPLGTFLALFLSRVRVLVTADNLTASIGIGPLRKKKSMACSLIRNVGTGPLETSHSTSLGTTTAGTLAGVIVRSSDFRLPLTVSRDEQLNNEVAGLVRYQLSEMGFLQPND